MANRTESQPSHKDRALEALADSAQEFGGPSAAAQRATAHATLAAAEQLEQLCTVLRSSLALQQAAELRMAGARR